MIITYHPISETLKLNINKEKNREGSLEKIHLSVQQQVNFINTINLKKINVQLMSLLLGK